MAAGVYLSIPFCRQKCSYCNFASEARAYSLLPGYLDALRREILDSAAQFERAGLPRHEAAPVDSIYLGGGTPGLLSGAQLSELRAALAERFALAPDTEFTIEAAPENAAYTSGVDRTTEWARAGVNRVSMGVQSMIPYELRAVGRKHTAAMVAEACANLRAAGIENISVDLIVGLPFQSQVSWRETLGATLDLRVPHLSVYMLEVDEDSRLGEEILQSGRRYGADNIPTDEQIVEFYRTGIARLREAGYEHYEISNFARPGRASRHNEKYWTATPYFGFGVDAHSYDGSHRWANTDSIDEYMARSAAGNTVMQPPATVSERARREELMFLGLRRRAGIPLETVRGAGMEPRLKSFLDRGWLEVAAGNVRLTDDGVIFSNEVFAGFLEEAEEKEPTGS